MKRIVALLIGILSTAIISGIVIYIGLTTNFDVQSFGIFFIIPLGSIIIGALAGAGYAYGLKMLNQKKTSLDIGVAALLGVLSALFIYFGWYQLTRVDTSDNIIYSLNEGTHISEYTDENDQPITFLNYMVTSINQRQISFSYRGKSRATTPENPIIGWADFIIELLGYMAGSLGALGLIISTKYCDNCHLYYKKKKWLEIDINQADKLVENIEHCINKKGDIYAMIQAEKPSSGQINMVFEGESCPQCSDGVFRTLFTVQDSDGGRKELDNLTQEVQIKHNSVVAGKFEGKKIMEDLKKQKVQSAPQAS